MASSKRKPVVLKNRMLGCRFIGLIGWPRDEADEYLRRRYGCGVEESPNANALAIEWVSGKSGWSHMILWVDDNKRWSSIAFQALVGHEIVHLTQYVMRKLEHIVGPGDEFQTYVFQWLYQEFMEAYERK